MDARRRTLLTAGATGAAALVAGCGGGGDGPAPERTATPVPATTEPGSATTEPGTGPPSTPASPGRLLARTSEIPVGGGKVFPEPKVVVTQPVAGQFKAFSAVCTHQGCTVNKVADGTIDCPCHGSRFRVADASVANGPATRPLPREQITVAGDTILLA
ncbi:Rieske (2Fe-2S) protein [Streptomyces sp. NPDC055078]